MIKLAKECRKALLILTALFISSQSFAQKPADWQLEKMPVSLETDFALSSLPTYLRSGATVYLLDPNKGYYIAHKGTNGFICFVSRTEWEWGDFRKDLATPISYDAEGARIIFPVYMAVAAMRASGKFTALQIRDMIISRVKKGIYKAPSRPGISYMLGPLMRSYPGPIAGPDNLKLMTMSMPHYMFYAPYLTNADIGNIPNGQQDGPVVINAEAAILGERKSPYGYTILPAGEKERAKIISDDKELIKRLVAYKPYFKIGTGNN
jgi:hypothetical protein